MFSDTIILAINLACIGSLVLMLTILTVATRMKDGGASLAAIIIVTMTVPAYMIPYSLTLSPERFLWFIYPTITLNILCIPALWFFIHRQMDKTYRFTSHSLPHLIPAIVSLAVNVVYYSGVPFGKIAEDMKLMQQGVDNLPTVINNILFYLQVIIYFPLIIWYIHRRMKYLKNNFSDSEYYTVRWIPGLVAIMLGAFIIMGVSYIISPFHASWIIPILNTLGMAYLVYIVIARSTTSYLSRLPDAPSKAPERENTTTPTMSDSQMKEICDRTTDYLQVSKAYTNPDFTIHMLSLETNIQQRNISTAINNYLHRNFFDFVNEMRVKETKRLLLELNSEYTTDSVYPECGFRSRSAFYAAFKKFEGVSPDRWRKDNALFSNHN